MRTLRELETRTLIYSIYYIFLDEKVNYRNRTTRKKKWYTTVNTHLTLTDHENGRVKSLHKDLILVTTAIDASDIVY